MLAHRLRTVVDAYDASLKLLIDRFGWFCMHVYTGFI